MLGCKTILHDSEMAGTTRVLWLSGHGIGKQQQKEVREIHKHAGMNLFLQDRWVREQITKEIRNDCETSDSEAATHQRPRPVAGAVLEEHRRCEGLC